MVYVVKEEQSKNAFSFLFINTTRLFSINRFDQQMNLTRTWIAIFLKTTRQVADALKNSVDFESKSRLWKYLV
jgi:hypothetical protein